jgi:hypothetical protein
MTDAPEGPEAPAERGTGRRAPRVGDSGSPVGSTLSIVLAVVAVVAGFLILRAITDDDDGSGDDITLESTSPGATSPDASAGGPTTAPGAETTTTLGRVTTGATVVVANASGVQGSAAAMTTVLEGAGYAMGEAGNTTGAQLDTSVVYYAAGDVAAQAVAASVATDMGGLAVSEMPSPPPISTGLGTATVLVMVGTDTANKTLADMNPATVAPPTAAGATSTTAAGG